MKKRLTKAASLGVEFFGGWKAVVIGSIPGVFWVIRKVSNGRIGEVWALCLAYAFAAVFVFIWKCFTAGAALEEETKWNAVLDLLNPTQKKQLQLLVNSGKLPVGQNVYDQIERSTRFIYRDMVGWWRIEEEYKDFLKGWAKKYND
jgi:hypothetical protein